MERVCADLDGSDMPLPACQAVPGLGPVRRQAAGMLSGPVLRHAGFAVYPAGATFGPRRLSDWELVWIITGAVVWENGGREIPAPPGSLLLCRPGMLDGFRWDPRGLTRHGFAHFDWDPRAEGLPAPSAWPLQRRFGTGSVVGPLCEHLLWLWRAQPECWPELAQGALRQILLIHLSGAAGAESGAVAAHPLVRKVLQHAHSRWGAGTMEPITLGDLARAAGVTRGHLARVFRAETGLSPLEALRLIRLERAEMLLARSNLPVQEVASLTGFDDPFHFSRVFRVIFGRSPRAWRRARLAGEVLVHPSFPILRSLWQGL